jgi:tetratricopeptide (TPR) repeat protein
MNRLILLSCSLLALTSCDDQIQSVSKTYDDFKYWILETISPRADEDISIYFPQNLIRPEQTISGSYLSSRFAQNNGDWNSAGKFVSDILDDDPSNLDFERKSMVLAMGSGRYSDAFASAQKLVAAKDKGSFAYLLLALEEFKSGDTTKALNQLTSVPQDGIGEFVVPLMRGWIEVQHKKLVTTILDKNPVHMFHAILMANYLNDRPTLVRLAQNDFINMGLSPDLLEQLEKIFIAHDLKSEARKIRDRLQKFDYPESTAEALTRLPITSPQDGLAQALYDMGSMLYVGYGDSARLFAYMALYLNPNHIDSRILLAQMATDLKRYDDAIMMYQKINTKNKAELEIKIERQIADLLEQSGKPESAIRVLKSLVASTKDKKAQIQVGDLYRRLDDFQNALKEYTIAASMIGEPIPKEYWELLYARGMTYERLKKWDKAEKDLKAALTYQPDHPYILNYLGYSWADQGIELQKAASMIERAVQLQPHDGYIVDSLGWVYYRMKDYPRAVKYLERAVELMPNDPTINDHLGDAYWKINRRNEARFQWKRALSFHPEPDQKILIEKKIEMGLEQTESSVAPTTKVSDNQ